MKVHKAKIFFVQEVKEEISNLRSKYMKDNFHLFELVRKEQRMAGGGLLIGVDKELVALQVRQGDDEVECLSVVVSVGGAAIRAVCGYGPQRGDPEGRKQGYWEYLEKEVENAEKNCEILIIQMDSNCYAGCKLIPNDPNQQNENGQFLDCFMKKNPTLTIVNSLSICEGLITHQRKTVHREETAVLDIFIVCARALPFIQKMKVDENGEFQLTNFHGTQKNQKTTHSDHNCIILNCNFSIPDMKPERSEPFNFKNTDGQQLFSTATTNTNKFSNCFSDSKTF